MVLILEQNFVSPQVTSQVVGTKLRKNLKYDNYNSMIKNFKN